VQKWFFPRGNLPISAEMGFIKSIVTTSVSALVLYYLIRRRTRIIGITGGIACGKTAVSTALHGPIVDADLVYLYVGGSDGDL
jgi:hypothetical protein